MIRLSCDDGAASDLRLADLCKKYSIDCTFYLPCEWHGLAFAKGYQPLSWSDAMIIAEDFDIGSHTITHRFLTRIPLEEAMYEIDISKVMLQDLFGKPVTRFAPPRGYTNPELTEYTLQIYESQRLTKAPNLVHIHPDSGANDNRPWREAINEFTEEAFCHSWELNKFDLWGELEDFFKSQE